MNKKHEERRKYIRIKKNFILTYFDKENPKVKNEVTQLKNISKGGMCFIASQSYEPSKELIVELQTPYLADITELTGIVLKSHEKIPQIIYEVRLKFDALSPQAEFVIEKLEEYFKKEKGENSSDE